MMRIEPALGVAVLLSATIEVFAAHVAPVPNDSLGEDATSLSKLLERFVSSSTSSVRQQPNLDNMGFQLKGFCLGMPILEAQTLAKKWLPDSQVVVTTNNCIEIDVTTHKLDVGLFEATIQPMYFCQADSSGKVYRFNFDKRFLKKWFRYNVQTYQEWAHEFGREHDCDFRYVAIEKKRDVGEAFPFTVKQDSWQYRNGLQEYKVTYFGEKNVYDPTNGQDASPADVGFASAMNGSWGGFPDNDQILYDTMRLTGYRMGVRAWAQYGYENGDGARQGTLRIERMVDSDF